MPSFLPVRGDGQFVRLQYSVFSAPLVLCGAKIRSLDFIFFFFISINIYLCVWFSPQKCSNICSAVVARNRYLLSTMPSPCKAPTGTQPASQLVTRLPVFKPSSRSQRSYFTQHKELLKARAGVITEIEKMWIISIFSYFSFFPHPLQTSSNQFTC